MKHIITVQHTQSMHHTNGMVGSWTDWDLTGQGQLQAQNIGRKLKSELRGQAIVLYTSDLLRARHTAEIIAESLAVTPILESALRERNLGKCCGKSVQWLRENIECREQTIDDRMFSDAESRRDVWNRLKPFFEGLMESDSENTVIVSHGDLLGIFNTMFLGLDAESIDACMISGFPGGVSHMFVDDAGKRCIRRISDMSYI